jgi:predicted metal-dependent peptidase
MGSTDIGTALAIIVDACNAIGTVTALSCDAAAGDAITVRHVDDLRPYFTGGGGTDMVAGIRAAAESVPEPDCIVVVTDGETPWPASPPATPVVIILTRNPSYCGAPPPWAEVIAAYKQ